MRTPLFALLLIGLAGCASDNWRGQMSPEITADVQGAIREGPVGLTRVDAGRGHYTIPATLLVAEREAVQQALAAAPDLVPWGASPDQFVSPQVQVLDMEFLERDVVVYQRAQRLRFTSPRGRLAVVRQHGANGWKYDADLQHPDDTNLHSTARLGATDELDRAWDALVAAADAIAVAEPPWRSIEDQITMHDDAPSDPPAIRYHWNSSPSVDVRGQ